MDRIKSAPAGQAVAFRSEQQSFLVLPDRGSVPNLASRALGLFLKRLCADWDARFGHPVFAVESFVDEARYRGTCYRACGAGGTGHSGAPDGPRSEPVRHTADLPAPAKADEMSLCANYKLRCLCLLFSAGLW